MRFREFLGLMADLQAGGLGRLREMRVVAVPLLDPPYTLKYNGLEIQDAARWIDSLRPQ